MPKDFYNVIDLNKKGKEKRNYFDVSDPVLASAISNTFDYARQNVDNIREVANTLNYGMTQRKPGDVATWDYDVARQTQIANAQAIKAGQFSNLFNTREYAFDKAFVNLTGLDYLTELSKSLEGEISTSRHRDEDARQKANQFAETASGLKAQSTDHYHTMPFADLLDVYEGDEELIRPIVEDWLSLYGLTNEGDVSAPKTWDELRSIESEDEYQKWLETLNSNWVNADWNTVGLTDYDSATEGLMANKKTVDSEIARRSEISALQESIRNDPNYDSWSVYGGPSESEYRGAYIGPIYDKYIKGYDDLGYFINSDADWAAKEVAAVHSLRVKQYLDNGYDYLTPDEIADYNALINAGRTEDAARYLELLRNDLLYRRAMVSKSFTEAKATNPYLAVPAWMEARLKNVANIFSIPQQMYEALTGIDNPYSSAFDMANSVNWTGSAQLGAIDQLNTFGWLKTAMKYGYNAATGATDNAVRLVASGMNPVAALTMAGLQSGSDSLHESASRDDMSGAAKILQAIAIGAMEVGTEKIGLDALFSSGKDGAAAYLKEAILSELGEESLNYTSKDVIDFVVAFLFGHEAEIKSGPEFWQGLLETGVTTVLSAGISGAGGLAVQRHNTSSVGNSLKNQGDLESMLSIAEGMQQNTESYKMGMNLRNKQKNGGKITNYDLGKFIKKLSDDIGEENSSVIRQVYDEAIENRLVELGESPEDAKANAPAIRRLSLGEKMTLWERESAKWSDNATQVVKELSVAPTGDSSNWAADTHSNAYAATRKTSAKYKEFSKALKRPDASVAVSKASERASAKSDGKKPTTSKRIAFSSVSTGVKGEGDFVKVVKRGDSFGVQVSSDGGKTTTEISIDDVTNYGGSGVGAILEYTKEANHDMSAEEVNNMIGAYEQTGGDAKSFIDDYENAYLSGYSGIDMPSSRLSDAIRSIAYEHGKQEAAKEESQRIARTQRARKVDKPTVGWLGDVENDSAIKGLGDPAGLDNAVKDMTDMQRAMVAFGRWLAEFAKINVVFYASKANEAGMIAVQNGSYDPNTHTIYLDVNSGAVTQSGKENLEKKETLGDAVGRALGHEVTHVLESTSSVFYAKYRQAVKDALKAKGVDYATLIREKINTAVATGEKLTYAGAEAEVIADASEYMLQDSKFVRNMETGLKGKVKEIARKFLNKVNEAFRRLRTSGHVESRVLRTMTDGVAHYEKKLQDLWDLAFDEMLGAEEVKKNSQGEQMEVGDEEKVQHSPRDLAGEDIRKTTIEDGRNNLKYVRQLYVRNDRSENHMYVPIVGSLDSGFLRIVKQQDLPVVMQVSKAMQAVAPEGVRINNSVGHNLSPAEIAEIVAGLNASTETYYNSTQDRWSAIAETSSGKTVVMLFDFDRHINPEYMYGLKSRGNHVVVTLFTREDVDDAFEYLDRGGYTKTPAAEVAGAISSPSHADRVFNDNVSHNDARVKSEFGDDTTHPMRRQFSVRQLAESLGYGLKMLEGTDVPYAIVDSNGREVTSFTADQIKNTPLGGLIDAAVAAGNIDAHAQQEQLKMIADLATLAAQYKDQAMVWEIAGSQLYSAIKNNSDKQYNKTVDFGTICSKTQAVVDVLSETMLKLDRGLTREEVITAYNKTAKNGLSVPCGPCYVFSRWMGVPGLLNSMANYQSRFGGMTAEEVTAYIDGVQARYSSDGERFSKVIGKQKTKLENRLESIASRMQKAMATGSDMTALFREADEVEREYADVEAYNWVTQVLCQSKRVKGAIEVLRDTDGVVRLDPSYKPVPHSILFDMRRTGEFAKYPKSWKYRSTRGAGMGKSILPYSGAGLGDTVYGEQKRRSTSQNAFLNPNMTKAQRIRAIKNATKRMKSQNLIGGHRFQSTSDYRPEWGLDYIMTFLEMQAVGAKGQLYTKVIEAVDMFATAGIEVNLSIMANGDGWHYDKNGNPVLGVEDFSSVSGIDFSEALKKTREYDNVQMILVGMNDTHIRLALSDDRITFVIPWHSSGSSESILKQLFDAVGEELHTGSDYQDIQSDKPVSRPTEEQKRNMALRTKIITGKFAKVLPTDTEREAIEANEFLNDLYTRFYLDPSATDTYGVKLSSEQASQVFPYEYWDTNLTYENADENGRRFVRYCESIGLVPRFEKFKDDHGYWKLLIDRRMYNRDGSYHTPEVIDVTGVEIGDIASSVSQAKYGDPVKTGNAVMETIEELRTKSGTPAYPEPSITSTMEDYGDEVDVEPRPAQLSRRDLPEDTTSYRDFLADADDSAATTIEEKNALTIYQKLLKNHAAASDAVIAAEQALLAAGEEDKPEARKALTAARAKQRDIYNRLLNVERTTHVQNVVNRTNQLMNDLSGKTSDDVAVMIADRERKIESLKADITGLKGAARTQREADIRENERMIRQLKSDAAQALLKNSEKYNRRIDEIRMQRDLNIEIGKRTRHIKRVVKRLNDRIVHEEDYKNVKEPLKPAVHALVRTFIDGFGGMVFDSKSADRLRSVYDELAKEDGAPEFYSDDVADWLSELSNMKEWDALVRAEGGSTVGRATEKLAMYSRVAEIADHIYKLVTDADEIFINGKRESLSGFVSETGNSLVSHKDRRLLVGKARDAARVLDDLLVKGNLTPQYFFEHLKNSGMTRLFDGLMSGQREYAQLVRQGQETVADAKRRYNFYAWKNMKIPVEFKTEQGHTIGLTVPQMMWVYATAKREATNKLADTHHLDQGGFKYDAKDLPRRKGKLEAIPGSERLHKLSKADVEMITNALTAEQKACADELVGYLSNECAEQGNHASMELFGIRKYNEEYYFPFKTASDQRYQRSDAGSASTTNDARVKHASFTHSLRRGANTPLVMGNFFDVIADHINLMATYSSFVVPIESMNRVLNTKINEEADGSGSDVTIRSLVGRKYGEPSQKYIADLLKDLNGGPQTDNRGKLDAGIRLFKKNAVSASLSVAVQQPTSYVRAFAFIDPKYFVHLTGERYKETMKRMMTYSGTAVLKEMGGFNVGMGKQAADWMANSDIGDYRIFERTKFLYNQKGLLAVKDNWIDFLTALPGFMDRVTWTHIWKAVEAEQADLHPEMNRDSSEFLRIVGNRFDDVINHTQVYDSILAKSQNMRGKDTLAKMATAFMAESTINMNMYYSAFSGDHGKKQASRIVASVVLSNVLAAAAAAAISAWNKDNDERTAIEQYMTSFTGRMVSNLNPLGSIPYLSDIWSVMTGYEVERADMSPIVDLFKYTTSFFGKVDDGKQLTWRDYENFIGSWVNLTGVPGQNLSKNLRLIGNLILSKKSVPPASRVMYGIADEIFPFRDTSNTAYYERYLAALKDGDMQEQYDLKDYLMSTKGVKENTIVSGVRDAYKKEFLKGGISKEDAISFLLDNDLSTGDTAEKKKRSAFQYVDKWLEGTDGYSAYNTLESAFSDGNSTRIHTAWAELTSNGYTDEQVQTQTKTILRELVESGKITPAKATELLRKYSPYKDDKNNINKPKEWLSGE